MTQSNSTQVAQNYSLDIQPAMAGFEDSLHVAVEQGQSAVTGKPNVNCTSSIASTKTTLNVSTNTVDSQSSKIVPHLEVDKSTRLEPNDPAQLPESEEIKPKVPSALDSALCLSFMNFDEGQKSFSFRSVNLLEKYKRKTGFYVDECKYNGIRDRCIFHILTTTADNDPVIGNQIVSETDLYAPLNCCTDDQPTRTRIFYLTYKLEQTGANTFTKYSPQLERSISVGDILTSPKRASLCGTEIYRIEIANGANLLKVHQAVESVLSCMSSSEMNATEGKEIAKLIIDKCSSNSSSSTCLLKLVQMSGIPDADISNKGEPFAAQLSTDGIRESEIVHPVQEQESSVPVVPSVEEDIEQSAPRYPESPINDPSPFNISTGFIITDYCLTNEGNRAGSDKDLSHITCASNHLKCTPDHSHILCPEDGYVSKDIIHRHIEFVVKKYKDNSLVKNVFIFVSAHGNTLGIKTSDGKVVPIHDLVAPMLQIGDFVILINQSCRGKGYHSAEQVHKASLYGMVFNCTDSVGCCLPCSLANCAAIFSSTPGCVSYRNPNDGSLMLKALSRVSERLGDSELDVQKLAEEVQKELHDMRQGGRVRTETGEFFVQVQFTMIFSSMAGD